MSLERRPASASAIHVILFDVGGVLVEVSGIATILEWLEDRITAEDVWRLWFGSPTVRAFETGRMSAAQFARGLLGELDLHMTPEQFLAAFVSWPARLYPGVMDLLSRIPSGCTRALLSNSNALHWPRMMDDLGLGTAFALEHRFASHLTGRIKPDTDAFQHALEILRCSPGEVLFLDDNEVNVAAAHRLGMHAARVRGAIEAERALVRAGLIPASRGERPRPDEHAP